MNLPVPVQLAKKLLMMHGLAGHEGWPQLDDETLKLIEDAYPALKRENYYRATYQLLREAPLAKE